MEAILHLTAHDHLPGAPVAYRQGEDLYVFAGPLYQPGFWLVRHRQAFSDNSAEMLSRRLSSGMRQELIHRYDRHGQYEPGRLWFHEIDFVRDMFLRAQVKAYRLSAGMHLARLNDPADPLLAPIQRPPAPSFDEAPTRALKASRFELADELGQILIQRWRSKDAADKVFWDEPVWMRAAILIGGGAYAIRDAAEEVWEGLVELTKFGRVVVQQVGDALEFTLETAANIGRGDFEAAARALERVGIEGIKTAQELYAKAEQGLAILKTLYEDAPTAAMLKDFLLGYIRSTAYVEQRTGVVKTVAVIGLEVLIALAAGAVTFGAGTVAVAGARLSQRIGQFSAKAIELLRKLYEQLRAFRSRKAARAGDHNAHVRTERAEPQHPDARRQELSETTPSIRTVSLPKDLTPDDQGVYGYLPTSDSLFHTSKGWPDWTNAEQVGKARATRTQYHEGLDKKRNQVQRLRQEGVSEEDVARYLVESRNKDRLSHYSADKLSIIYERNLANYGNKYGPTYEKQLLRYGSPEKIIEAALRPNDTMDVLTGLANVRR